MTRIESGARLSRGTAISLIFGSCVAAAAADKVAEPEDFAALSLEELAAIKVTSVSKKAENLNEVPAAVTVLTTEEIRRSGAQTLPYALRLAPGVQVGQVDSLQSAVSVRGFNDTYSQKLLVLIDGRSVYTPLFSGTFWQAQDLMLEDLDRIEVVRGPGGTIWGANAVNGVINVVSKPAEESQGLLLTGGGGSFHNAFTGVRYGAKLTDDIFLRVYGKYDDWSDSELISGGNANDEWWKTQGGFRLDWEASDANRFTLQGDIYGLEADQTSPGTVLPVFGVPPPPTGYNFIRRSEAEQTGGNILGRWTHSFSSDSDLSIQTYYDRSLVSIALLEERRNTFDLDARHRWQAGDRNEIVWGGGYRLSESTIGGSESITFSQRERSDQIFNLFAQDEITLIPDLLRLTFGTKLEHNDYTGFELEPGARLSFTPTEKQTIWASVARAVRTPSQIEHDGALILGVLPPNPPFVPLPAAVSINGAPGFESETLIAYELGYRIQPHRRVSFDLAGFVNDYDELRSIAPSVDFSRAPNYILVRNTLRNESEGITYGGELSSTFQATDWWRLQGSFSVIEDDLEESAPGNIPRGIAAPDYQTSLRSSMDLGDQVELDLWLRYASAFVASGASIPGLSAFEPRIPSYVTFDARIAWHPRKDLELALVGQNLAGSHREFNPTFVSTDVTRVRPSVYGKLTWTF